MWSSSLWTCTSGLVAVRVEKVFRWIELALGPSQVLAGHPCGVWRGYIRLKKPLSNPEWIYSLTLGYRKFRTISHDFFPTLSTLRLTQWHDLCSNSLFFKNNYLEMYWVRLIAWLLRQLWVLELYFRLSSEQGSRQGSFNTLFQGWLGRDFTSQTCQKLSIQRISPQWRQDPRLQLTFLCHNHWNKERIEAGTEKFYWGLLSPY